MIRKLVLYAIIFCFPISAQQNNPEIDIFIIDSFVAPEEPYQISITFFTSEEVKSEIEFQGKQNFIVSDSFAEDHKFTLPLDNLEYDSTIIPFKIKVTDENGNRVESEVFDLYLPEEYNIKIKNRAGLYQACIGGITFLIPAPSLVIMNGNSYFSLSKEFPVFSFYNSGYNFPNSYFALEYSYIFSPDNSNYLRLGYKYIYRTRLIKYISPGINFTTNFSGFNGVSPELSFGLFKLYETFTVYLRYRYNIKPNNFTENFSDISIGLFTSALSFN